jgi:hypothetical protein
MTDQIETPTTEEKPTRAPRAAKAPALPQSIGKIIPLIRQELGSVGKDQKATGGGANYAYRGHDQIINAIVPLFDKYGVWVTVSDELIRYDGRNAGTKYATHSVIREAVRFHAPDGSWAETTIVSESVDYGNKATGQAGTYAYRIAIEKTFTIPTNAPDPDAVNEEFPATAEAPVQPQAAAQPTAGPAADAEVKALKQEIAAAYSAIGIAKEEIPERGTAFFNGRAGWDTNLTALGKLLAAIQAGEESAIGK